MRPRLTLLDLLPGRERYVPLLLISAYLAVAALAGLIVSTGKVVLVALALGAGFGFMLLGMPVVTTTIVLIGTLVLSGPLVFHVQALERLPWLFSVLGFILTGSAIAHAGLDPPDRRRPLPGFVVLAACFSVYAAASAFWALEPVPDAIQGIKRHLQYWGLLFALAVIAIPAATVRRWALLLTAISLVQFLMGLYQRFILIPGRSLPGMDAIVGSLELSQSGTGASGVLALIQICCIGALLCAYREQLISRTKLAAAIFLTGLPLVVGETNVLFLWLPLVLLAVYLDRAIDQPAGFLLGGAVGACLLAAFASLYLVWQQSEEAVSPQERVENILEYNIGEAGYHSKTDLNRKTALEYWWQNHGAAQPVATVFGHGIGGSFSSDDMSGWEARQHGGRHIDLLAISSLLWDLGLFGLSLFLGVFVLAAWRAYRLAQLAADPFERALARAAFAAIVVIVSSFFYNNAIVMMPSQQAFSFTILGFVAWLDRRSDQIGRRTLRADATRSSNNAS